jgi:hypothetical protein
MDETYSIFEVVVETKIGSCLDWDSLGLGRPNTT